MAYDEIGQLYLWSPDTQAEVNALAATFNRYPEFAKSLREASEVTLYQGTPVDGEAAAADVISFDGFEFWKDPIKSDRDQAKTLQDLFSRTSTVYPFRGFAECADGFHPDWRLSWTHESDQWHAYLCFGCDEMQVFKNGDRVIYCCLRDDDALKAALQ